MSPRLLIPTTCRVAMMIAMKNSAVTTTTTFMMIARAPVNFVNADQITPYAIDQTFCLKLSHALIFSKYSPVSIYRRNVSPNCFLHICSPNDFPNPRTVTLMLGRLQRRPCLRLLPTCATGSALCVMGGRQQLLGHACCSYMCMGSALDVMDYRLARAEDSATH